jgi:ribosomal protein S18 acetylase RimI-like enzyme
MPDFRLRYFPDVEAIADAERTVKSAVRARVGRPAAAAAASIAVRAARPADIAQVAALDRRVTRLAKPEYWQRAFERSGGAPERSFLVAESRERTSRPPILGFILGEVRAWEFGSAPCGWVLALSVDPRARLHGVGHALFEAMAAEFKAAGVRQLRTMVARDNRLHLMFFRSQGMAAGPYLQLETELD